jgi:hypothetical protein
MEAEFGMIAFGEPFLERVRYLGWRSSLLPFSLSSERRLSLWLLRVSNEDLTGWQELSGSFSLLEGLSLAFERMREWRCLTAVGLRRGK